MMKNILNFDAFNMNESSAAGNRDVTYDIPFKYSSNDPKYGYNSKSFVEDLESIFIESPELKREILEFLVDTFNIITINDLKDKPFSLISDIIPEIERIIDGGGYEPELMMPGEGLLFIRDKKMKEGTSVDFYINKIGTKIEVIREDENGKEISNIYNSLEFPFDEYQFTEAEIEEFEALLKAKGIR